MPCAGSKLGQRVDGAEACIGRVGRDEVAPKSVLLGGVEQKFRGEAIEQEAVPDAGEPCIPRENCWRRPVGYAERALLQIELVMQGARGALVNGDDGPALLQRLLHLPGQ